MNYGSSKKGSAKGKCKAERKKNDMKLDHKVKEEITNKWRKLNTTEKAIYGSALEGSSGQVNDSVNEMSCITRCSPDRFHHTVEKLSNEKRLAISAIGFGNVIRISAVEFGRVMGLKNTGEDVQLDRPVEDEKLNNWKSAKNANEDFKVRFVMFALGTVLCPTSSPSVTGKYLTFLTISGKIETKNWADHGFNFLCEGVRSFKAKKVAYSLDPIVSWDNNSVWKMIKWVIKQGGFDSPTVRVVSQHRRTNEVSGVNVERIVQEVSISLAPVIQAEVKRSIEGLALGQIIQAEVQRSVLELTDKVMSQVRSFMKDARHEDVNQAKEDGPPKIRDEGGENAVKKKGEESRKLKEKGPVHVNNPWTPLPDGQTFSEPEFQHASERVRVALSLLKNPKNKRLKEVRESARRVVDEELDKLAEHGPSIPHHPIARKPMTRSQAK
ncbi:Aminotransferase-like, plant mobile domain family protein [Prunus dulcis]|uniref:Aminotransferase-like, plant mobile domain family protein n=1 Tax=Prunus dulcis TaxID=3755 RepID=A0A4Y1RT78_PRUDU|nr:Aminotransferase-like, plant mobile domain family protein [Prunus dulcis]